MDEFGAPGPRAVVLLHGAVVNRGMWSGIGEAIASSCRVLAPDLPGHGDLAHVPFRLEEAASRVVALVAARGAEEVVLVGESLGGYVALATARGLDARLRGLVLSGASVDPTGLTGVALQSWSRLASGAAAVFGPERLAAWTESTLRRSYPNAPHEAILRHGISVASRSESLRELAGRDFLSDLSCLEVPVLLLNGSRDLPNRLGEAAFSRRAPNAESRLVRGVGHGVALGRPDVFREELIRYLDRHLLA